MSLMDKLKLWWLHFTGGIVTPPEEPDHRLTIEEALECFYEEEWEDENDRLV